MLMPPAPLGFIFNPVVVREAENYTDCGVVTDQHLRAAAHDLNVPLYSDAVDLPGGRPHASDADRGGGAGASERPAGDRAADGFVAAAPGPADGAARC